ncbi:unnamed protein product [Cyclocybe aegerita]|uniref:Methyltransferase domain-containing protein n=1 Tax=Cyclocybe aegerita TaxID=1973307 RepID=A0A8S0W7H0_CYCAE|nr:unnamed protein product [Cyclocybe aegerita]
MTPHVSPPLAVSHSGASTSHTTSDGKRPVRRKEFQFKYGQKHHSYDNEKAPYPLSYDKHVLELESLDNRLCQYLRNSVSFMNFKTAPARTLDLGCGTGTWVIDAAKEWPECELVGFDLVDIQIPLKILDPAMAKRIEWRHGNFLTTKLPFDDDDFDHVHIQSISKGVPENKWNNIFEEVYRVLRPGGSVEVVEDDIIFPSLPRWFTNALRARPLRAQSIIFPDGSQRGYPASSQASSNIPPHEHALLESLYKSVFEHRFVNLKPSSVLPSYLTTYFRQVTLGPVVKFPMPPLPPIQPLPPQLTKSYIVEPSPDIADNRSSTTVAPSTYSSRPMSLSFSSSYSTVADSIISKTTISSRPRTSSEPLSYHGENSYSSFDILQLPAPEGIDVTSLPIPRFILDSSLTESEISALPPSLFPLEQLASLSERSLAMHLYRSFQSVLACQEAMWEELKDRIRNRRRELLPFGWEDDEELEELQSRKKFERLIERYRSDMYARVSLWSSLDSFGWPLPAREPLSKAELIEEDRLRESMIEARKSATVEEMQIPCRAVRVVMGYKL